MNRRNRLQQCCNMDSIKAGYWMKLLSMFNIVNIPSSIKKPIFMSWLYATGMLGVWRGKDGEIHYGTAQYADDILEDGTSSKLLVSTVTTVERRNVEDTGVIWLNSMRLPLWDMVNRYSKFTREGDISLLVELFNTRSCKVPTAVTDSEKRQYEEIFKAQERGQRYIPKVPSQLEQPPEILDLNGNGKNNLSELLDFRQRIVAEFDTQLGIGVFDGLKRERMITGELNNIQTSSRINVQDMYDRIKEGIEDCNEKLGLDMTLEWGECYNVENVENVSRETIDEEVNMGDS